MSIGTDSSPSNRLPEVLNLAPISGYVNCPQRRICADMCGLQGAHMCRYVRVAAVAD
jgi:hypothetical protein